MNAVVGALSGRSPQGETCNPLKAMRRITSKACYALSMLISNWEPLLGFPLDD